MSFADPFPGYLWERLAGQPDARANSVSSTDGPALSAIVDFPTCVTVSADGNTLFFVEYYQAKLKKITNLKDPVNRHVVTLNTGGPGLSGSWCVRVGPVSGNLYVSDTSNVYTYAQDGSGGGLLFSGGGVGLFEFSVNADESALFVAESRYGGGWNIAAIGKYTFGGGFNSAWLDLTSIEGDDFFPVTHSAASFKGGGGCLVASDGRVYENQAWFDSFVSNYDQNTPLTGYVFDMGFRPPTEEDEGANSIAEFTGASPGSHLLAASAADGDGWGINLYELGTGAQPGSIPLIDSLVPQRMYGANNRLYVPSAPMQTGNDGSGPEGGLEGVATSHAIYSLTVCGAWCGSLPTTNAVSQT